LDAIIPLRGSLLPANLQVRNRASRVRLLQRETKIPRSRTTKRVTPIRKEKRPASAGRFLLGSRQRESR
jgi:hypothetical protein